MYMSQNDEVFVIYSLWSIFCNLRQIIYKWLSSAFEMEMKNLITYCVKMHYVSLKGIVLSAYLKICSLQRLISTIFSHGNNRQEYKL